MKKRTRTKTKKGRIVIRASKSGYYKAKGKKAYKNEYFVRRRDLIRHGVKYKEFLKNAPGDSPIIVINDEERRMINAVLRRFGYKLKSSSGSRLLSIVEDPHIEKPDPPGRYYRIRGGRLLKHKGDSDDEEKDPLRPTTKPQGRKGLTSNDSDSEA